MNLKQLSEALGLSPTTVSRALNGYPEVSEKTRAKVIEAARKANYRPDTRARSLATGQSMTIGHVIPVSIRHEVVNPVFADFVAGAGEVYAAEGYEMLWTQVSDEGQEKLYRDMQATGHVDGVVVQSPGKADPRIPYLDQIDLPYVVHGRATDVEVPYSYVDVPNAAAFRDATDYLIGLGHRRIALINGNELLNFASRRRAGYEQAMTAAGLALDPSLMHTSEMTEFDGFDAARRMLAAENPPTAFLTASLISAFGVRRAVENADLKIGRDISVMTFDDDLSYLRNGTDDTAVFTAVRSSVQEAGRRVAAMLIARIREPGLPPQSDMVPYSLIVGETTGPPPDN